MNAKLCECGCGQPTTIAKKTQASQGQVAGQPTRFLRGHCSRVMSEATRLKIAESVSAFYARRPASLRSGGTTDRGRKLILVGRDHPMADKHGYAAEYRLIMAEKIGRPLTTKEIVHHIDGDHQNNDPENLAVMSQSQHFRVHNLLKKGIDPFEAVAMVIS